MNPLDVSFFNFLNDFAGRSRFSDKVIIFFADHLGYLLILFLIIFFWKYVQGKKQAIIVTILSAVLSRFVITEIIRFLFYRPRPFLELHVHQLIPEKGGSFPSGHASFFFAIAMSVYLLNKKWGIGFFILTTLVGIARVMAGVHYPSDILGGAFVGVLVSYLVFRIVKGFHTKL